MFFCNSLYNFFEIEFSYDFYTFTLKLTIHDFSYFKSFFLNMFFTFIFIQIFIFFITGVFMQPLIYN